METDASTLDAREQDSLQEPITEPAALPALVVVWDRVDPGRAGEVLLLSQRGPLMLGRATRLTAGDPKRLQPIRQRPGENEPRPPLASPRLSREQLAVWPEEGRCRVENRGRLPLTLNGHPADRGQLQPGDLLQLGNELLLLFQPRPQRLPPGEPAGELGAPDADGIVGEGPAAWALRGALARAAARPGHVLIRGPSGSGKELIAAAVHRRSGRRGPLIARSAATFPEGLIDAELFGSARNYPNPGLPARPGLVGEASGGSLFLDEIGELPEALQARLLRLLDSGAYHRLGEANARRSDLRFLAATNRPEGALKHDLLARMPLRIAAPGLGDRPEDVPLIAAALLTRARGPELERFFREDGRPRLSPGLVAALIRRRYTTHVRELQRLLWLAIDRSRGRYIDGAEALAEQAPPPAGTVDPGALTREDVLSALARCDGVQSRAWRELGLTSRHQLRRLMKKLDADADAD